MDYLVNYLVGLSVKVRIDLSGYGMGYWGLTPQQQPGSYQGGEMMTMNSVFWWRKPEYPEETTDLCLGELVWVFACVSGYIRVG